MAAATTSAATAAAGKAWVPPPPLPAAAADALAKGKEWSTKCGDPVEAEAPEDETVNVVDPSTGEWQGPTKGGSMVRAALGVAHVLE